MKIGIDARLITQTGVGVYTRNLLTELASVAPKDWELAVFIRSTDQSKIALHRRYRRVVTDAKWHTISEQLGFYRLLQRENLDLVHFTYFSYPILYRRPFISTIHDLTPVLFKTGKASTKSSVEYYPKYFAMKGVIASEVRHSRAVIAPTNVVKQQILQHYPVNESKIYVTPEGIDTDLMKTKENATLAAQFNFRFLLYIGNFYPHKNVQRLVEAFASISSDYRLVLVGPKDHFSGSIERFIRDRELQNRVVMFHDASREDLVFFYKHARALIHPSLSEGYGLTPIESMYFGTPVLASNIPVFQETLGERYTSFDPHSVESIAQVIASTVATPKRSVKPVVQRTAFRQMAEKTVAVYKSALGI